jgi:hypothetical protein
MPGSGKTTLVRQMVARAIADGWWVAYIDATRTLAPQDWAAIGANDGLWVVRPRDPARGAWCADVLLRSGAFAMVVLDGAPLLDRGIAVRLTRLARESDAAFLAMSDESKASELAGSLRLRVATTVERRRSLHASAVPSPIRRIQVVIEKGAPYQTVTAGEVDRGNAVARRVRTHPEIPDRRGVARQQQRINTRSRRAGEPRLPTDGVFIGDIG